MIRIILTLCLLVGIGTGFLAKAQNLIPAPGPVFNDAVLPRIYIEIEEADLAALYDNPQSYEEYPARFSFESPDLSIELDQVGFRFRGNTSRASFKKSFKISFNTFNPSQKFFGLEKMNLNGEHNDPSIMRAKLAWDICSDLEIPASRSNHILLYINDRFWGVYINVEHVDEEFVQLRFGNKEGNLYKCLWPADLQYRGTDPNSYKLQNGGRRAYELRTNVEQDDYTDLALFIDVLNNSPVQLRAHQLEAVFEVDRFLHAMVMDVFTANWDGPLYNKNNFYLYKNTATGKFEYLPYDLDNTFGIDWFGISWAQRDVYDWSPDWEPRPLYEKILEVPEYRERFTSLFKDFLNEQVLNGELVESLTRYRNKIAGYVSEDHFYTGDYGWRFDDFMDSYHQALDASHVPIGLIPYIESRAQSALVQLDPSGLRDLFQPRHSLVLFPNPSQGQVQFQVPSPGWFSLYTVSGQCVFRQEMMNRGWQHLNLNSIPGLYFARFVNAKGKVLGTSLLLY